MFFSAWRVRIFLEEATHNVTLRNGSRSSDNGTDSNPIPDEIWATRVGVFAIGGTAIACFGLLCNLISIVVLSNFRQRSSAPYLLVCLEVVDSLLLLSEMLLETLATLSQASLLSDAYRDFIRPAYVVMYPVPHIAQTGTTLLTVLITLERYVAVARPLLASTVCSRAWARRAVLLILVWSLLFHVPLYLAYSSHRRHDPATNSSRIVFQRTAFGESHFYNYWFVVWINLVFEFILPFILIAVFNVLMLRALRASHSMSACSGKRWAREGRLSGMVVAVTVIFFVCELFPAVALIVVRGKDALEECSTPCAHFVSVADTTVLLNSAVNFLAYCAIGKQFRDIFARIFLRRRGRHRFGDGGGGGGAASISRDDLPPRSLKEKAPQQPAPVSSSSPESPCRAGEGGWKGRGGGVEDEGGGGMENGLEGEEVLVSSSEAVKEARGSNGTRFLQLPRHHHHHHHHHHQFQQHQHHRYRFRQHPRLRHQFCQMQYVSNGCELHRTVSSRLVPAADAAENGVAD